MEKTRTSLGIVVPRFAGEYDPKKPYAFYVFVRDGPNAFISKKPSVGGPTTNEDYWFQFTDFSDFPGIEIGDEMIRAAIASHNADPNSHRTAVVDGGIF